MSASPAQLVRKPGWWPLLCRYPARWAGQRYARESSSLPLLLPPFLPLLLPPLLLLLSLSPLLPLLPLLRLLSLLPLFPRFLLSPLYPSSSLLTPQIEDIGEVAESPYSWTVNVPAGTSV